MKKLLFTVSLLLASQSSYAQNTIVKSLDLCFKGYKQSEVAPALAKCQESAASFQNINQNGVQFKNPFCVVNAQGVGAGFASQNCGVYDVVLKTVLIVTE